MYRSHASNPQEALIVWWVGWGNFFRSMILSSQQSVSCRHVEPTCSQLAISTSFGTCERHVCCQAPGPEATKTTAFTTSAKRCGEARAGQVFQGSFQSLESSCTRSNRPPEKVDRLPKSSILCKTARSLKSNFPLRKKSVS